MPKVQSSHRPLCCVWLALAALLCGQVARAADSQANAASAGDSPWQALELPLPQRPGNPGKAFGGTISDLAIEPRGPLWVMANQGVHYWTGREFQSATGETLTSGQYLCTLWGGGDRPLYATQAGKTPNQGTLVRLADGTAKLVATFYYDVAHEYPGIHVLKSGRVINWGQSFVATLDGSEWKRHEVDLGRRVLVAEEPDRIHLIAGNRVVSLGADGKPVTHELNLPADTILTQATLWGDDRLLVHDSSHARLRAFRLPDCTPAELGEAADLRIVICTLARFPEGSADAGSVLLGNTEVNDEGEHRLLRLAPDTSLTPIAGGNFPAWSAAYMRSWPESALFAQDGSTWLISENRGIARIRDGQFERFGWQQGLADGGARAVLQDHAGNIYAGFHHGVWMLPADGRRAPLPAWHRLWTEHPLAASRPVQDPQGRLWMALADHPQAISCWDGQQFTHRAVPFETRQLQTFLVDDAEHLLAVVFQGMSGHAPVCYDIGPAPAAAEKFATLEELFVAAVKRGARQFRSASDLSGPIVDKENRIWFGHNNSLPVSMYNGTRWQTLSGYASVNATTTGEVIVSGQDALARYDQGVLVPLEAHPDASRVQMFGPNGILPFEPTIYAQSPASYLLRERPSLKIAQPLFDKTDLTKTWQFPPGEKSPPYMGTEITRGRLGSQWTSYCACDLSRIFAGRPLVSDFHDTPLVAQSYITNNIFDDPAGNLWIHRSSRYHARNAMFMKNTEQFQLEPLKLPQTIRRGSVYTVRATDPLGEPLVPQLYWRADDGPWIRTAKLGELPLDFDRPGKYRVRVVMLGPQAEFCRQELDFAVEARDPNH